MLRTRVIPVLLLRGESLVKTVRFGRFTYVGDPCNTVRIFNELEVDELCVLDITATRDGRGPNLNQLADLANECFMPLAYGGGISSLAQAEAVFKIGIEKVILNTAAVDDPAVLSQIATTFGSQAVIASIDVGRDLFGHVQVYTHGGKRNRKLDPVTWAKQAEGMGAGEILLTAIEREGSWSGFDLDLVQQVADAVNIPVIAHGGGGSVADISEVVTKAHASAVALGSMVVFQKKGMGVLVNFPDKRDLERALA